MHQDSALSSSLLAVGTALIVSSGAFITLGHAPDPLPEALDPAWALLSRRVLQIGILTALAAIVIDGQAQYAEPPRTLPPVHAEGSLPMVEADAPGTRVLTRLPDLDHEPSPANALGAP